MSIYIYIYITIKASRKYFKKKKKNFFLLLRTEFLKCPYIYIYILLLKHQGSISKKKKKSFFFFCEQNFLNVHCPTLSSIAERERLKHKIKINK